MVQTTTESYKKRRSICKEEILISNASGEWKALDETQGGTAARICSSNNSTSNNVDSSNSQQHDELRRPVAFAFTKKPKDESLPQPQLQEQQQSEIYSKLCYRELCE